MAKWFMIDACLLFLSWLAGLGRTTGQSELRVKKPGKKERTSESGKQAKDLILAVKGEWCGVLRFALELVLCCRASTF